MIRPTTVDLILVLSTEVAKIMNKVLERKASRQEQERAYRYIAQIEALKNTQLAVKTVTNEYNRRVARIMGSGRTDELYNICTAKAYRRIQAFYQQSVANQVAVQSMEGFDLLGVSLTSLQINTVDFLSHQLEQLQTAEAYVYENWRTHYRNGGIVDEAIVNQYLLVWHDHRWKIDEVNAFLSYDDCQKRFAQRGW
ncbi:MAG: hypothetical protein M9928_11270 [Anaerolineae bacterium]|nr:hypothetical protein [Anaerolineae bacterium]MCO5205606.1 hypothetical protein [Anaerolineae bacterium]